MTKLCACGKTKTIQPYNASGTMKFTCDACRSMQLTRSELEVQVASELDKIFFIR